MGLVPQSFIMASLGNGIEKVIKNNESVPSVMELFSSPEIYQPIIGFFLLLISTIIIRKIYYKK